MRASESVMDADNQNGIPISLEILALFLRLIFIGALVAIAVRVSLPLVRLPTHVAPITM